MIPTTNTLAVDYQKLFTIRNSSANIVYPKVHILIQGLGECHRMPVTRHQASRLIVYHCTRWEYDLQVYCPLSSGLPLHEILVMPACCVFCRCSRNHPYKSNSPRFARREEKVSGPYLTPKGPVRTAWVPSILLLQDAPGGDIDLYVISIITGTVECTILSPCIVDGRAMDSVALRIDGHLVIQCIGDQAVCFITADVGIHNKETIPNWRLD